LRGRFFLYAPPPRHGYLLRLIEFTRRKAALMQTLDSNDDEDKSDSEKPKPGEEFTSLEDGKEKVSLEDFDLLKVGNGNA
jgi:hypothetical protein